MADLINRLQTPEFKAQDRLGTSQVISDTYHRPEQNPGAGQDLLQLGQALSQFSPTLNNMLARQAAADQAAQAKINAAAGRKQRLNILDPKEAERVMGENTGKHSEEWIDNYEMADAQIHANTYPAALEAKLRESGLWNNEKADPQEVAQAMAEVRQQYMQRGDGAGAAWVDTFDQYSSGFERGVMNQWVQHTQNLREANAKQMIGDDLTAQLLAHQQLDSVDDIVKGFVDYREKSFTNKVLTRSEVNEESVKAFIAAHSSALNSGNTALASRIAASFEKMPTRDAEGNVQYLARTEYGGNALAKMHQDEYFYNRQQKDAKRTDEQELRQDLQGYMFDLKQPFQGLTPSKIPALVPGDPAKLRQMEELGFDPQSEWSRFRQQGLVGDSQVRTEDSELGKDTIAKLQTRLYRTDNLPDLKKVLGDLYQLDSDPTFSGSSQRDSLNRLIKEAQAEVSQYKDTGKIGSRAFRSTDNEVKAVGSQFSAQAIATIGKYQKDLSSGILSKYLKAEVNDDTGAMSWGFSDLDRQMRDAFNTEADSVANGRKWSDVPLSDLRQASDRVIQKFKPMYEHRIKDVEQQLKDEKKKHDEASAQAEAQASDPVVQIKGPSGILSQKGLEKLKSATSTWPFMVAYEYSGTSSKNPAVSYPSSDQVDGLIKAVDQGRATNPPTWLSSASGRADVQAIAIRAVQQAHDPTYIKPLSDEQRKYSPSVQAYQRSFQAPVYQLGRQLQQMESDPELMKAVTNSAVNGSLDPYEQTKQAEYRRVRFDYQRLAMRTGFPTELSTASKPPFKPEWVDFVTMPMFSKVSDITDENLDKLIKNLKLVPGDYRLAGVLKPDATPEQVRYVVKANQMELVKKYAKDFNLSQ